MPVLLALLSSLLWGTSDFLGGRATRRLAGTTVVGLSQLVALLALTGVAVATGSLSAPRDYVLPGVLAGLVGVGALGSFYRALSIGTMGVVAPIASLGVVLPVVVGVLRGEAPSTLQLAGTVVAVAGVVLASGPELSGRAGTTSLLLAAGAAVGFGAVLVLLARGSEGGVDGVVMTLLTMRLTSVVGLTVLLLVLAPRRGLSLGVGPRDLGVLVAVGLGDVAANAAFAVASRSGLLSVVSVLSSLYPVVTVLLARRLLAERLRRVQVVGITAALVGVAALAGG